MPRIWILPVLIILTAALGISLTLHTVEYSAQADEGVYLLYATRLAETGPTALRTLCREYIQNLETLQYFPDPLRLTTTLTGAMAVRTSGPDFGSLQQLSLAAFLILLGFVFIMTRRMTNERTAVWTLLLVSASPLHLAMARRALSDSLVATLMTLSLWLLIHNLTLRNEKPYRWSILTAVYALTFLAKAMTLILIPISLTLMGWQIARRKRMLKIGELSSVSIFPLGIAAFLTVLAAGGTQIAWQIISTTFHSVSHNPYAIQYGGGPWFRYLIDYLLLSPWTVLLYLIWVGFIIGKRPNHEAAYYWAAIPALFLLFSAPAAKVIRYALVLEVPIRLGATFLLIHFASGLKNKNAQTVAVTVMILLICAADLATFTQLFVKGGIYDPVSAVLLKARGFLP